jgi:hypothetical protein
MGTFTLAAMMNLANSRPRSALCIAHRGHELRVFQWVRDNRPLTHVLTDGAGPDRKPRISATASTLEACVNRNERCLFWWAAPSVAFLW